MKEDKKGEQAQQTLSFSLNYNIARVDTGSSKDHMKSSTLPVNSFTLPIKQTVPKEGT